MKMPPAPLVNTVDDLLWQTISMLGHLAAPPREDLREWLLDCAEDQDFRRDILRPVLDLHSACRSAEYGRRNRHRYDVVIVGGGMISLYVLEALAELRPNHSVLILESARGARIFAEAGDGFRLNTDARHTEPFRTLDLSRLSPSRFPLASIYYDGLRLGWFLRGTPVWCAATATSAKSATEGWRIRAQWNTSSIQLEAGCLVVATGFGGPSLSSLPNSAQSPGLAFSDPGCGATKNIHSLHSLCAAQAWSGLESAPWWRDDARVAVIGAGPSSLCAFECLGVGQEIDSPRFLFTWSSGDRGFRPSTRLDTFFSDNTSTDRMILSRYGPTLNALENLRQRGQLTISPGRASVRVADDGIARLDDLDFDLVVDCTGYSPKPIPSFLDLATERLEAVDGFLAGPRLGIVGDCLDGCFEPDLNSGPLQQWARSVPALVQRVVPMNARIPPRSEGSKAIKLGSLVSRRIAVPAIPCHPRPLESVGVRWLLRLIESIGAPPSPRLVPGAIELTLPLELDARQALSPRTVSVLHGALTSVGC